LLLSATLAACATTASAQTITVRPNEPSLMAPAVEQARIALSIQTFVPSPNDNSDQTKKAEEDARRTVYDLAGHECAILRDTLAGDCRLESINVNIQRPAPNQNFGQRVEGFNVNANIGFRIVPK
jgi:hypothetical protein